jgi:hypothetical protein
VIDSNAKIPAGILEGNIKLFGSFDECISVKSRGKRKFTGQYCLADIDLKTSDASVDKILDTATLGRRIPERTVDKKDFNVSINFYLFISSKSLRF